MTLDQLRRLKRWQVAHRREHPVEYHAHDAVLTLWIMGRAGLPAALVLAPWPLLPACLLCSLAPDLYVGWRARLHARARLRCDWLAALPGTGEGPHRGRS